MENITWDNVLVCIKVTGYLGGVLAAVSLVSVLFTNYAIRNYKKYDKIIEARMEREAEEYFKNKLRERLGNNEYC
jgi:hypothetical protein